MDYIENFKVLTVKLPKDLEVQLSQLSAELNKTEDQVVVEALRQYVEDKLDYIQASKVYSNKNKTYTHEQVLNKLGL